jgi:tricorn protease
MSKRYFLVLSLVLGGSALLASGGEQQNGLIQYPSVSPSGDFIVFSAAGDLWSVPSAGGSAARLTTHPGIETQGRFNADGTQLVFESNRDGAQNLYTLDLHEERGSLIGGEIQRVTASDRAEMLGGYSDDGETVLFSSYLYPEIYRHPRMYKAPLDGGPITQITEAFGRGPSTRPDSEDVYFIRGYYYPHRVAYRGPGNLDIWRFRPSDNSFVQVTHFAGNDMNPWALPDGSVVYVSSRDGQYNLVRLAPDSTDQDSGAITQLTHFKPDDQAPTTIMHGVRDLSVSQNGTLATFVVWNTLYTLDLTDSRATPKTIERSLGADSGRDRIVKMDLSKKVSQAAVHPSGKAIAQIARGELFVRSTEEDYPTHRVTATIARERDIAWSPDGMKLYFVADDEDSLGSIFAATVSLATDDLEPEPEVVEELAEVEADEASDDADESHEASEDQDAEDGDDEEDAESAVDYAGRWANALRFEIEAVVEEESLAYSPKPSPDGTKLMYLRDRGDIVIRDLESGDEQVVSEQWSEPDILWASDSRHIVFAASDLDFNYDIFLLDTQLDEDGELSEPINISRHPDIDHSPQLSHDGKVLSFLSDRDNQNGEFDVYRVFLDRELDGLRGYELAKYFEEAVAAAGSIKPLDPAVDDAEETEDDAENTESDDPGLVFDTDDAYLRIRRLTSTPESESSLVMTPGGERIAFSTVIDGARSFVSVDYKGKDRKAIKSGNVSDPRVSVDGKQLSFIAGGRATTATPVGGSVTTLGIDATIEIDRHDELAQKFNEAAGRFGMSFYHPTMKGLDWDAMTNRYRDVVMQTRTNQAFLRVMNMMWGEVDGSHTGIRGGDGFTASSPANGYLGIDFTPVERGYRIDAVLEGGPIDRMKHGPSVGDVILSVGETNLESQATESGLVSLHQSLAGSTGDEVLIEYLTTDEDGVPTNQMGLVTPAAFSTMSVIRYKDEVAKRRAQVEEMSDGKLGYLHIRSMGLASVRDYERDLFAAADGKEGLIIDVRDNGGGWTTDILLASLTAPNHAYTIPRGADPDLVRKDNYPRDRRLIYAYSRPINVLINQNSFSNAEIFAHSIRNTKRGTLIGTQTFGGVISTGSFRLIDGTTVRRPFRGWYLPDGTDMESNGAKPDIDVAQTPSDEAAGRDPQLEAAIEELLGRTADD